MPDVTLVPFYRLFDRRYAIFWDVYRNTEWESLAQTSASAPVGLFDRVAVGDSASEQEHGFEGFQVRRGEEGGRRWIASGDWIKFDLRVPAADPCRLVCTFAETDTGKTFSVTVDGKSLTETQVLKGSEPGVRTIAYAIPREWSAGKKLVAVIFRVNRGEASEKLFGCAVEKTGG